MERHVCLWTARPLTMMRITHPSYSHDFIKYVQKRRIFLNVTRVSFRSIKMIPHLFPVSARIWRKQGNGLMVAVPYLLSHLWFFLIRVLKSYGVSDAGLKAELILSDAETSPELTFASFKKTTSPSWLFRARERYWCIPVVGKNCRNWGRYNEFTALLADMLFSNWKYIVLPYKNSHANVFVSQCISNIL